jgi:hypothetical protein
MSAGRLSAGAPGPADVARPSPGGDEMKYAVLLSLWIALPALQGCSSQIQVPVNDSPNSPLVWRDKIDPDVFAEKTKSLRLSFDTTVFSEVSAGPAVQFSAKSAQRWNDNVDTVNVMYRALANDFNAGLLSLERFNRKRDAIDALYAQLAKDKQVMQHVRNDEEQQRVVERCKALLEAKSQDLTGK